MPKKFSDSGAPGSCGSASGGEWWSVVGTECGGGGLPAGPGCSGGGLPAGPGGEGGGASVDTECDEGGLSAGPGCGGGSSGDPGCDPVGNVGLEVAVSESDDIDAVLSELIVFHSVSRYSAFVEN